MDNSAVKDREVVLRERHYRRGVRDGYVQALINMHDLMMAPGVTREVAYKCLWDFWEVGDLRKWAICGNWLYREPTPMPQFAKLEKEGPQSGQAAECCRILSSTERASEVMPSNKSLVPIQQLMEEMVRAEAKFGTQEDLPNSEWFLVLMEEVGEAAKSIINPDAPHPLDVELLQVAAVALRWLSVLLIHEAAAEDVCKT